MKLFIVFAFVMAVVCASDNHAEQRIKLEKECMDQEKSTQEEVVNLRKGVFDNATQNLKCHTKCVYEKGGFFANGAMLEDVVKARLGPVIGEEVIVKALAECKGLKGPDDCDTAFQIYKCMFKYKPTGNAN